MQSLKTKINFWNWIKVTRKAKKAAGLQDLLQFLLENNKANLNKYKFARIKTKFLCSILGIKELQYINTICNLVLA